MFWNEAGCVNGKNLERCRKGYPGISWGTVCERGLSLQIHRTVTYCANGTSATLDLAKTTQNCAA